MIILNIGLLKLQSTTHMLKFNFLIVFIFCLFQLQAQKLYVGIQAGIATGTPAGKIPEGATGALGIGPAAGILIGYQLTDKIGIQLAPGYAQKKSRYHSPIAGKTQVSDEIFGIPFTLPFNLNYEGVADGSYNNHYIDLPLQITYTLNKNWRLFIGGQVSRLLQGGHTGEVDIKVASIINVKDEPFDQSEFIREWDWGAMLGANFELSKRLSFQTDVYVGLRSMFTDDFEELEGAYRNAYMKLQLGYKVF